MKDTIKLCVLLFAVGFAGNYIGRWQASWGEVKAVNIDDGDTEFVYPASGSGTGIEISPHKPAGWFEMIDDKLCVYDVNGVPQEIGLNDALADYPDAITLDHAAGLEFAYDPNDLLIEIEDVEWLDVWSSVTIETESGGVLELSFSGDELQITGDADMNEAAKVFFNKYLKRMADDYIAERLNK